MSSVTWFECSSDSSADATAGCKLYQNSVRGGVVSFDFVVTKCTLQNESARAQMRNAVQLNSSWFSVSIHSSSKYLHWLDCDTKMFNYTHWQKDFINYLSLSSHQQLFRSPGFFSSSLFCLEYFIAGSSLNPHLFLHFYPFFLFFYYTAWNDEWFTFFTICQSCIPEKKQLNWAIFRIYLTESKSIFSIFSQRVAVSIVLSFERHQGL